MRVPATLKEARALLRKELPQEAWRPLLPGYRGLEVESEYGGVRQRWLLVESQERARMEEASLQQRIARVEGEARKVLGRLTARTFACEADARRALSEASGRLPLHRLIYLGVQEERQWERVGRPRKGERPLAVVYRLRARLEVDQEKLERARRGLGRFLLATNVLDREGLPPQEVLRRYKDQARTVERGFRFLKDPLFFAESTFLKRPERVMALGMVMALALLVYALGEWALRRRLWETGSSLPDQKGRPTAKGVSTLYVGPTGGAGGQVVRPQPGSPSRDRGAPPGGRAILPAGVKGVRNVGWGAPLPGTLRQRPGWPRPAG